MLNKAGREIPMNVPYLQGREVYQGEFAVEPTGHRAGRTLIKGIKSGNKLVASIAEAIEKVGLKDGMSISFHHHFRNGDYVVKQVLEVIHELGIKDITLLCSSLAPVHEFVIEYIEDGTITAIETSGLRDKLGKYISKNPGKLKRPIVIRSHGGRARAIVSGEAHIDVAFCGVPTADARGNSTGMIGKSACGALGYAMVDAAYADKTVVITDNLVDAVYPVSIPQTNVDYVVVVEEIGDPEGIASGAIGITKNPVQLKIAEMAAKFLNDAGAIKEGYSFQLGAGGAPLAVAQFLKKHMDEKGVKAAFGIGGATGILTQMLEEGYIGAIYDTQTFDTDAAASLAKNPNHIEISASMYADPWTDNMTDYLDVVFLGATEVDLDFNVNVMTDSNGILMGASGGHSDTAAGADITVICVPLIRGRLPMIRDNVQTIITPGASVDVIVTDWGIAINPNRPDLKEAVKDSNLPIFTIEELQELSYKLVGKPVEVQVSDKEEDIVAVVEYRDGTILDVIYKPLD